MAAIVTRCTCGCEIRLETDQPKLFINNRVCHMCKSPVKFKQNQVDKFEEQLAEKAKEAESNPVSEAPIKAKKTTKKKAVKKAVKLKK